MTELEFQKSCALHKINQRHTVSEHVVNPANLDRIRRHGETGIKQALVEAVSGPEQHLMPTRRDRVSIPISGRVMNAENSHNAKTRVLEWTLPSWNTSCALLCSRKQIPSAARSFAVPLPCLSASWEACNGNDGGRFGLYFHIEQRR